MEASDDDIEQEFAMIAELPTLGASEDNLIVLGTISDIVEDQFRRIFDELDIKNVDISVDELTKQCVENVGGIKNVEDWYTRGADALITETGLASDITDILDRKMDEIAKWNLISDMIAHESIKTL